MSAITTIDTAAIEAVAPELATVLREEKVLGTSDSADWNQMEEETFADSLVAYAAEGAKWGYHEVTYSSSNTRLIIKVGIENNVATITSIGAYDHPYRQDPAFYEALTEKLQKVAGL